MKEQEATVLAQEIANAVIRAMCATRKKWRIPFTGITIGFTRNRDVRLPPCQDHRHQDVVAEVARFERAFSIWYN